MDVPGESKGNYHIPNENIIKAILDKRGLVTKAAQALGCSPQLVWKRIREEPTVKEACRVARSMMLDVAESKLFKRIDRGEYEAVKFYLTTIGKKRGYTTASITRIGGDKDSPPVQTREMEIPIEKLSIGLRRAILAEIAEIEEKEKTQSNGKESTGGQETR